MPFPDDDTWLEILALYQWGFECPEIDARLRLIGGTAALVVAADAAEYPQEPIRVLH